MVDDFLAIAYIDSDDKSCVVFHAVGSPNSTGQVVITVGGDSLHGRLTYGIVRHSLEGIFHLINIGENSWFEIAFDIFWEDVNVGRGYVDLLNP